MDGKLKKNDILWKTHEGGREGGVLAFTQSIKSLTEKVKENLYSQYREGGQENVLSFFHIPSVFTGPRCLWGPVYGSRCLYLSTYLQELFETLLI